MQGNSVGLQCLASCCQWWRHQLMCWRFANTWKAECSCYACQLCACLWAALLSMNKTLCVFLTWSCQENIFFKSCTHISLLNIASWTHTCRCGVCTALMAFKEEISSEWTYAGARMCDGPLGLHGCATSLPLWLDLELRARQNSIHLVCVVKKNNQKTTTTQQ